MLRHRRSRRAAQAANSIVHASVTKNRYGKGGQEYWIFEPDSPRPRTAPVIIFLHGWGGMNPLYYGAWLDHLVKRGNIVDLSALPGRLVNSIKDFTPNTLTAVKDAFGRLQTESGHVSPDFSKFARWDIRWVVCWRRISRRCV